MTKTNVRVNVAEVEAKERAYGYNYRALVMAMYDEYDKCTNKDIKAIIRKTMDLYADELMWLGYYD